MIYQEEAGDGLRIVRSDGAEMVCSMMSDRGWKVAQDGMDDFIDMQLDVVTSANVLTDGSALVSKRVGEVERTCSIFYAGDAAPSTVRNECLSFFNPKHSFEVHVTHLGVTRWCEGELVEVECALKPGNHPCECMFTLLCLDPYMRGEDIHDDTMQDASGMFTFPFMCFQPSRERPSGCVSSFRVYDGMNTVYNDGGIPAPFRIRAEFSADVKNPTFRVNDKHVSMTYTFHADEVLVIDFMASPPELTIDGVNSIGRATRDSTFVGMVLDVGSNTFSYEAEEGDVNTMDVSIVYYERYMGV